MNREKYRAAMDRLSFSEDFETRTIELLREKAQPAAGKERENMKRKKIFWRVAIAAAMAAALSVTAVAAVSWLTPSQVANRVNEPVLAKAFEGEDAISIDETVKTGDFTLNLAGLVTGKGLKQLEQNVDETRTYAVLSIQHTDGTPMSLDDVPFSTYTFTPLVSGYAPWTINMATLDAEVTLIEEDGSLYYLLDTKNLEMFADHTVYLAFFEGGGFVPSSDIFTMGEDGAISFADNYTGAHALFELPLDESKADPAAVTALMESLKNQDAEVSD